MENGRQRRLGLHGYRSHVHCIGQGEADKPPVPDRPSEVERMLVDESENKFVLGYMLAAENMQVAHMFEVEVGVA